MAADFGNPAAAGAVAVIGSTTIDLVLTGKGESCKIGGVTTYAGITYRRLGFIPHIVSNIADAAVAERLRSAVALAFHPGASALTTRFVNTLINGERFQEMPAAADPIGPEHVGAALAPANWVHLGPLHPADLLPEVLDVLKRWGRPVLLDAQGYTRRVEKGTGRVTQACAGLLTAALQAARIVKTNRLELDTILAEFGCTPSALVSHFDLNELVVTEADRGGAIFTRRGQVIRYGAPVIACLRDPTGAGDVFFAAYAARRLGRGDSPAAAARQAAELAARQLSGGFIEERVLDLSAAGSFC